MTKDRSEVSSAPWATLALAADAEAVFAFHGCCVGVRTNNAAALQFIGHYFAPSIAIETGRAADFDIYGCVDTAGWNAALQASGLGAVAVEAANAVGMHRFADLTVLTESCCVGGADGLARYLIDFSSRSVCMLIPAIGEAGYYVLMRLVRALLAIQMCERGMLGLHAACVARGSSAIALTGDAFSGKTTTLINMLSSARCDFVANDKIFVSLESGSWFAYGLPISAGVRVGTIGLFPMLSAALNQIVEEHYENKSIVSTDLTIPTTRVYVRPERFRALFGCGLSSRAALRAIVVPTYDEDRVRASLVRLGPMEARQLLTKQHLGDPIGGGSNWLSLAQRSTDVSAMETSLAIGSLASDVAVYRLLQNGRTRTDSIRLLDELLDYVSSRLSRTDSREVANDRMIRAESL